MGYLQTKGLRPNPDTSNTILGRNSAYKIRTQNCGVAKIKDLQGPSPNKPLRLTSVLSQDTLLLFGCKNLAGEDSKLLVEATHDIFGFFLLLH